MFSIVKTLEQFRTILLVHRISVYTDHKILTFDNFTTERVLCWRSLLEKYEPTIKYIKVYNNESLNTLSRLPLINSDITEGKVTSKYLAQIYFVDKLDGDTFPLTY